jgi:hypothetical protein
MKGIPMKKLILVGLLLLLALQIVPAAATPLDDLTQLARYFPDDTHVFAAMRIDDDYFAALDGLIAALGEEVPGLFSVTPSLRAALDDSARQMTQGEADFDALFRSWMGDTVALAVENTGAVVMGGEVRPVVALSITDRDAAEAFLDNYIVANRNYTKSDRYGGVLYETENRFDSNYLLLEDVILATLTGEQPARTLNLRVRESLAESDAFSDALAALPADEYNILVYANLPEIIAPLVAFAPMAMGESAPPDLDLTPIVEALGAMTLGFTIVDNQSLVMDVSLVVNDPTVFRDAGLALGDLPALDLDFAAHLPAETMMFVQDQNFGGDLLTLIDGLDALSEQLEAAGVYPLVETSGFTNYGPEELAVLQSFNLDDVATFLRQSFQGMTGLTLQEGLGWLTGDYATYVTFAPLEGGGITPDIGVVNAVTDTASAQALYEGLQTAFDQGGVSYTVEENALALPFLSETLAEAYGLEAAPEGNLLVGLNDEVLAVGMRSGVEQALNPQNGGLAATALYQSARGAFLPDAHLLWYVSTEALIDPLRMMLPMSDEAAQTFAVIEFIGSMSITATSDENGTGVMRFALTIAE